MSITDELRKEANKADWVHCTTLRDIADRIDAEHEEAIQREHEVGYAEGYGAGLATVALGAPEWIAKHEGEMAENGWYRVLDADRVPVCIGDVMTYTDNTKPMEVVALVPPAVFLTEDGPRYADMCRHYHAPTVEDVLTQFGIDWEHESDCEDRAALLKEYAAKLRLAEEDA